ncbi:lysophospholipid acyltransferase family protein [bacterium]|nr:lysophospholipid acyltransferase family protein [bacterium]MDC1089265.1 lysophospholipid acyltransferase family protein [Hellea sp.]
MKLKTQIIWRLEALIYDIVSLFFSLLPFSFVSGLGAIIFKVIGPMTNKHKIVRTGLMIAFPEKSREEINNLASKQWDNIGRTFAEFPVSHKIKIINKNISVNGLSKAIKNTPALFISGHFSNWEIILSLLIETKLPVQITYRKLNNPYIDARIRKQREKNGARFLIQKSGQTSARNLLKALKNKQSVATLNDQKFNEGISVPFFGVNAMTAQGFVRLALKTNLPLLPVIVQRKKSKFTINFYEPIHLIKTKNKSLDVKNGVIQINKFIEERIRENPDQWFWAHRRWPNFHYE